MISKDADGGVEVLELTDPGGPAAGFSYFAGARSGLLGDEDVQEASAAMDPDTVAALLVYENTWAAPFVAAARRSGGELDRQRPHPRDGHHGGRRGARGRRAEEEDVMPGLLRGVARTAVVAGTATAVSGRVQRRQAEKFAGRDAQIAADREQAYERAAAGRPAAAPAAPAADPIQQLKDLADLKDQGVLTEEEFAAQKAKILASTG